MTGIPNLVPAASHHAPRDAACEMTPAGRGAVASVGITGDLSRLDAPPALFHAANGRLAADQPVNRICFGQWGGDSPEDVVACRTGESLIEIHCHGGRAAVDRILRDLGERGFAILQQHAFTALHDSPLEMECRGAMLRAVTRRTMALLAAQHSLWTAALSELVQALTGPPAQIRWSRHQQLLDESLRWTRFAAHLTQPRSVVLFGRPNVGKSSLINALLGYTRSIVYDEPGTTRDVITADTALDGWPVQFSDTAGLRHSSEEIEAAGIVRARQRLEQADLKLLLLDAAAPLQEDDRALLADHPDALLVATKRDLPQASDSFPRQALAVSARTGFGLRQLIEAMLLRLVPEQPPATLPLPVSDHLERQIRRLRDSLQAARQADALETCCALLQPARESGGNLIQGCMASESGA